MSDHIFSPQQDRPEYIEELYTLNGLEDFVDKSNAPRVNTVTKNTFAKKITRDDGSIRYSIRCDTNGKLYNPISMYDTNNHQTFLDRVCRSSDKFKNVSYKVFDLYINFLRTKNVAWLHNAERELS